MADVAKAAGVSRQTLYYEFGSKDGLAEAVAMREAQRYMAGADAARVGHEGTPAEAIAAATEYTLTTAAENPLLKAVLTDDAGGLLPFLTTRADAILDAAREQRRVPAVRPLAGPAGRRHRVRRRHRRPPDRQPPRPVPRSARPGRPRHRPPRRPPAPRRPVMSTHELYTDPRRRDQDLGRPDGGRLALHLGVRRRPRPAALAVPEGQGQAVGPGARASTGRSRSTPTTRSACRRRPSPSTARRCGTRSENDQKQLDELRQHLAAGSSASSCTASRAR